MKIILRLLGLAGLLLVQVNVFSQDMRSTPAVAAPTLMHQLSVTAQEYSWIVAAFQATIMLQPICGYALDVLGLKAWFAIFAVAWSFINMAHGLAHRCRPGADGGARGAVVRLLRSRDGEGDLAGQ